MSAWRVARRFEASIKDALLGRPVPDARDRSFVLPGLLHALLFTALAFVVAHFTGPVGVGATALGVLFGVLAGNLSPLGPLLKPGVAFVGKRVLAAAVVLLGLRVTLQDLAGIGGMAALAVGVAILGALVLAWLLGRLLGVPAGLAALIGAGTGICGISAIAAARPAVGAKDEDVTYAVAAITALGSIGLLVYPVIQLAFHPFEEAAYGIVSGATLHSVPQAIGAAFAGGGLVAGGVATVVKLARVAMLGPLVLVLGVLFHHRGEGRGALRLPVEVWGFLALFVVGSVFVVPDMLREVVAEIDRILLVWALTALGLQTRFVDLKRAGAAPLVVAVGSWLGVVVAIKLVVSFV